MFLLQFFRYLQGYVWFEARGQFVERFLNLMARNRISVWGGRKQGEVYRGCVAARDYPRLRAYAKKAGVRLKITEKRGMPFQRRRYRKRTGLLVGLAVFFAFLYGMSLFIWRIEVAGNERVDEVAVLQALEKLEIAPGTLRRSIDVRECERKLLLLLPDLSWAALNIDGSAIHVELKESILPPELVDPHLPCNIVAKDAGQILRMNVYDGQALVGIGDTVLPGDIIVSGITQDGRNQSLYRHARAEVFAQTMQELEVSIPLAQQHYTETGKAMRRRYLGIFNIELPFFLPLEIPSPYRVERETLPLTILGNELPLFLLRESYILMEETPVTLSESEAEQEALRELALLEQTHLAEATILDKQISGRLEGDVFLLHASYDCILDIALEQEILVERPPAG